MSDTYPKFKAAVVQATPVFLNRAATIEKAGRLICEAGKNGAALVVFPEVFVPGYPYWIHLNLPRESGIFYQRLFMEAMEIPGQWTAELCRAAKAANIYVVIGINEKSPTSMGTLWNTNLIIDRRGKVLGKCRKLVPTRAEKMVWAQGDGSALRVFDTDIGKLGTLICGTNANPLARFALLAQGEQVHIANYPAFPNFTREIEIRSRAHSHEGKVFTLTSTSPMSEEIINLLGDSEDKKKWLTGCEAYSAIYDPKAQALVELADKEGIIYAEINIEDQIEQKQIIDICGHYNRFDVLSLNLTIDEDRAIRLCSREPISIENQELIAKLNSRLQLLEKTLEELKKTSALVNQLVKKRAGSHVDEP